MTAADLMIPSVKLISPEESVENIMELIRSGQGSGFIVANSDKTVMGVVGGRDLYTNDLTIHIPTYVQLLKNSKFEKRSDNDLPYVAKQLINATASDVMNQSVFFASPTTPLQSLAAVFLEGKQTIIPVVDTSNKFLGAVTLEDVLRHVTEGESAPQIFDKQIVRPVYQELTYVQKDMSSRFSYIARSKAHVWLTSTMVLFIIGFILGIIFIVDPQPIVELLQGNFEQLLESIF